MSDRRRLEVPINKNNTELERSIRVGKLSDPPGTSANDAASATLPLSVNTLLKHAGWWCTITKKKKTRPLMNINPPNYLLSNFAV